MNQNYPMQFSGLGGLNTVQNMSDRNNAETLMANGGQRFARGGISNIPRMAAGGVPTYKFDPITGKYTQIDDAAVSSDVPKYTYDPVTQKYTLVTEKNPLSDAFTKDSGGDSGGGGDTYPDSNPAWSNMTNAEKAAYYAANPTMAAITQFGQKAFGMTGLGQLQARTNPGFVSDQSLVTMGVDPVAYQNARESFRSLERKADPEYYGFGPLGDQVFSPEVDTSLESQGAYSVPAGGGDGAGGDGGSWGDTSMGGSSSFDSAYSAAKGGMMALAQGGISNLGDYSDGGRLLRGPGDGVAELPNGAFVVPARITSEIGNGSTNAGAQKLFAMEQRLLGKNAQPANLGRYSGGGNLVQGKGDGVSDSVPATIGGRQPARIADGEVIISSEAVKKLGNGSTEAGARKLYQMLARVQNARKKSIGQGRVAVNSRAEKLLPA